MPRSIVPTHSLEAIEEAFTRWRAEDPIAELVALTEPEPIYLAGMLEAYGYLEAPEGQETHIAEPWARMLGLLHRVCGQ